MSLPERAQANTSFTSFMAEAVVHKTGDPRQVSTVGFDDATRQTIRITDINGREVYLEPNEALHIAVAIQRLIEGQVFITQPPAQEAAPAPAEAVPAEAVDFDDPLN